jgi:hypothetical protein
MSRKRNKTEQNIMSVHISQAVQYSTPLLGVGVSVYSIHSKSRLDSTALQRVTFITTSLLTLLKSVVITHFGVLLGVFRVITRSFTTIMTEKRPQATSLGRPMR